LPHTGSACAAAVRTKAPVNPEAKAAAVYNQYYPLYTTLYGPLKDHFAKLAAVVEKTHDG